MVSYLDFDSFIEEEYECKLPASFYFVWIYFIVLIFILSFSQYENGGSMSPFKKFNIPKTQPDENQSL